MSALNRIAAVVVACAAFILPAATITAQKPDLKEDLAKLNGKWHRPATKTKEGISTTVSLSFAQVNFWTCSVYISTTDRDFQTTSLETFFSFRLEQDDKDRLIVAMFKTATLPEGRRLTYELDGDKLRLKGSIQVVIPKVLNQAFDLTGEWTRK